MSTIRTSDPAFTLFTGALVAALAVHWFLRGESLDHSALRTWLVAGQFVLGAGVFALGWRQRSRVSSADA